MSASIKSDARVSAGRLQRRSPGPATVVLSSCMTSGNSKELAPMLMVKAVGNPWV